MGELTTWDAASLDELEANLKAAHQTMEDATNELEQQLEAKLSEWSGDAREAYYEAKQKWEQSLHEFAEVIQSLSGAVVQIKDGFQTTERTNTQAFS